jgi:mono/diheme cytochrome c family protein
LKFVATIGLGVGLFFFAMAVGAKVGQTASAPQDAPAAVQVAPITDGAALFQARGCVQCHTIRGVGGHKGPDLSGVGRRLKKDAIQKQITSGGSTMPAFGDALPGEEIAALVKYLHHCKDKMPKGYKPAPTVPST